MSDLILGILKAVGVGVVMAISGILSTGAALGSVAGFFKQSAFNQK